MPRRTLALLSLLLLAAGCPGRPPGGDTPREAFDRAVEAAGAQDWRAFLLCWEPGSRDLLVFAADLRAGEVADAEALKKVHERYGVLGAQAGLLGQLGSPQRFAAKKYGAVKPGRKAALFAELMDLVRAADPSADPAGFAAATLAGDPAVDGEQARGEQTLKEGGKVVRRPLFFTRTKGRWRLAADDPRATQAAAEKTAVKTKTS